MTPEQFDEYEKRKVAIHESGHLTVGASFQRYFSAEIWRAGNDGDESLKNWRGRACLINRSDLEPLEQAAIGLAGVVAECLAESEEIEAWELVDYMAFDVVSPSPSDWESINAVDESQMEEAAQMAIDSIKSNMTLFDWLVSQLLIGGVVTNGMLEEFVTDTAKLMQNSVSH